VAERIGGECLGNEWGGGGKGTVRCELGEGYVFRYLMIVMRTPRGFPGSFGKGGE